MCEYLGNNKFTSTPSGQEFEVTVNKRTVDATYLKTSVPSTHTPNFSIDNDVNFVPLNNLPIIQAPTRYMLSLAVVKQVLTHVFGC
jgi:hypothetical protein